MWQCRVQVMQVVKPAAEQVVVGGVMAELVKFCRSDGAVVEAVGGTEERRRALQVCKRAWTAGGFDNQLAVTQGGVLLRTVDTDLGSTDALLLELWLANVVLSVPSQFTCQPGLGASALLICAVSVSCTVTVPAVLGLKALQPVAQIGHPS